MATVDGITVAKAEEIEGKGIATAGISNGQLTLTRENGAVINAGDVSAGLAAHEADLTTHGVTSGEIVGTQKTQTITNKTLITPIIDDLTNAQHDHSSAAEGGLLPIGYANSPAPITTLTQYTVLDADAGNAKTLASFVLVPGRWLILATCEGVTLNSATATRFSYNLTTSSPTLVGKPVFQSSVLTGLCGGASISGWLENAANATINFTFTKQGTGAQVTNSTNGSLIAIRMG